MFNTQPNRDHNRTASHRPEEVSIPLSELEFSYSRSGGPGGQNVNKVSSKVTLKWDFWTSRALTMEQKGLVQRDPFLSNRINADGVIVLQEQQTRSQDENRQIIVRKLHELVKAALTEKPERIETEVPASKRRARLHDKKRHSQKKQGRGRDYSSDGD